MKLKGIIITFVIALIVFIMSIMTLRANRVAVSDAIAATLVDTEGVIDPKNNGHLVLVSGTPELLSGTVDDEEMDIHLDNTITYTRDVQQLVYEEESEEVVVDENDINDPYDDDTETRYYIVWSWISANADREEKIKLHGETYVNPAKVDLDSYIELNSLNLGEFEIPYYRISNYVTVDRQGFTDAYLSEHCRQWIIDSGYDFQPEIQNSGNAALKTGNQIGDLGVFFSYDTFESAQPVTIVGRQNGNTIEPFQMSDVEVFEVMDGIVSRDEYVAKYAKEDSTDRAIGVVFLILSSLVLLGCVALFMIPKIKEKQEIEKNRLYPSNYGR